jgi:hypothetical protein
MADPLEIAHQRKLIEVLKEYGRSTTDAEGRLAAMLHSMSAVHGHVADVGEEQPALARARRRPARAPSSVGRGRDVPPH